MTGSAPSAKFDSVLRAAFWSSVFAVAFVAGALSVLVDFQPGPQIARAYEGGKAAYGKLTAKQSVYRSDLWMPASRSAQGVTRNDPRAQDGVILYTSGHAPAAFLIDMQGNLLHEWRRPFSTVWNPQAPEAWPKEKPQPDDFVYFRKARILPNGELLALYEAAGDTPYGYGLAKLDRNSNVIWSYLAAAHHDFDVGPDGRIYVLTQEILDDRPFSDNMQTPRLEDFLVILGPDGSEQQKIRLTEAVADSQWRRLLHMVTVYATGDPLHTNTVTLISEAEAVNFPFAEAGQVLLSFRELGTIGVLDVSSGKLVWAARGPWIGQHDPDVLTNGNVLLFDNYGHFNEVEGLSRVIEFDPRTMEIVWQYAGSVDEPFQSEIRSWQQRLDNGNTLIVESNGGRFFEVTPEGEIVWEFLNPERRTPEGSDQPMIPIIGWAESIDPDTLDPGLLRMETN